jgi:hypothetical protein
MHACLQQVSPRWLIASSFEECGLRVEIRRHVCPNPCTAGSQPRSIPAAASVCASCRLHCLRPQNTLQNLQEVWCQQPAAGQPAPPRQLTLKLGQQPSGSQLPEYQPPTWLKDHTQPLNSALDTDLLNLLVGIPSLSSLRCQFIRLGGCRNIMKGGGFG